MQFTWDNFPSWGTTNYYNVGKGVLDTWVNNFRAMDALLESLPASHLDANNNPAEGYCPVYRDAAGKIVWENITGVVGGDTYQVKRNAADSPGYLDDKVPLRVMELPDVTTERIIGSASGFDLQEALSAYIAYYDDPTYGHKGLSCDGKTIADGSYVIVVNNNTPYFYLVTDAGLTSLAQPNITGYGDYHGIAVIGNYLYRAVGDSSASYVVKIERYDPATNSWTTFTPSGTGPNYQFRGAFEYDGLLWLAGRTIAYDPATNSWVDKSGSNPNMANFSYLSGYVTEDSDIIYGQHEQYGYIPKKYDPATDTVTDLLVQLSLAKAFYKDGIIYGVQSSNGEYLVIIDQATGHFVRQNMPFDMATRGLFPVNNDHVYLAYYIYPNMSHLKKVLAEA